MIIEGAFDPTESKTVKFEQFHVPYETSEIIIKFDYAPRSSANIGNHLNLLIYDSMDRFMGRFDSNFTEIKIGLSPSKGARKILPLPGNWKIVLEAHGIFGKIRYRIEIETKGSEKYYWKVGELHSHSIHSDGVFKVSELADYFKNLGFDFFFLTDHSNIAGWEELKNIEGISAFPGQEINTLHGHMLVLGCKSFVDWKNEDMEGMKLSEIRKLVKFGEGIIGVAHPFIMGDPLCFSCEWNYTSNPFELDFVEIWTYLLKMYEFVNERLIYEWIKYLRKGKKLTGTVGGDFHRPEEDYLHALRTIVGVRRLTLDEVLYAIKFGKVYLSRGGKVDFEISSHTLGDVVEYNDNDKLVLKLKVDNISGNYDIFLLTRNDTVYLGENHKEIEYKIKNLEDKDFALVWIKDKNNRTVILTNPIYLEKIC